jgi:hypothetical protein
MVEMVSADGEGITVATKDEHVQILSTECDAGGKGQSTTVDKVYAVGLHKVGEPTAAADSGYGGKFLLVEASVLDELEVKGEHRKIAATRAPCGVVGGEVFFLQRFAGDFSSGTHGVN